MKIEGSNNKWNLNNLRDHLDKLTVKFKEFQWINYRLTQSIIKTIINFKTEISMTMIGSNPPI